MISNLFTRRLAAVCFVAAASPAIADGSPHAFLQQDGPKGEPAAEATSTSTSSARRNPGRETARASGGGGGGVSRQIPSVSIGCLRGDLMGILRRASNHFGQEVVITSGYRGGRGRSYHAKCMAADVQIAGVGTGTLARYFRGQAGVGGVGSYGHTRSVHVDVAPRKFSWHGRSSRRVRTASACPCCGGSPHGGKAAFACERGVVTPAIRLGAARV